MKEGATLIFWNCELDTLRSDLGLFGFPAKSMQHDFLSTFRPVFYIRQRDYSKTVNVSPYIVNYSGALFRDFPGPWQIMLRQADGEYACIAEDSTRYVPPPPTPPCDDPARPPHASARCSGLGHLQKEMGCEGR